MTEIPAQKNKLAGRPYEDRPVGSSQEPDLAAMTKEERDARRDTVERLSELFKQAEKGNEEAVPEIRKILHESPDLAWRFMDFAT